jgi:hypothetical protein
MRSLWTPRLKVGEGKQPSAGRRRQRASEGRRKTFRGDIVIGRPAISLKTLPWTRETISHLYGLDDGKALPVA